MEDEQSCVEKTIFMTEAAHFGSEIFGRSEAALEMHSGSEMPPHPKGRTPGGKRRGGTVGGS
jgi:hypothetical protein